MTLVHIYNASEVLLGLKKRGFGAGLWNGFGGKVQPGEDIHQAALRELHEEAGIKLEALEPAGKAVFYFGGDELLLHYFRHSTFNGEATESEEMLPRWFKRSNLPLDAMWPADKLYLSELLQGKILNAVFWLNDDKTVAKYELRAS